MEIKQHIENLVEFDKRALRNCFGKFATGVTVMTAQYNGENVGVTVNSFASLSIEPPLILWSISKESKSLNIFKKAKNFAVNILSSEQIEVSKNFATADIDKFANVKWEKGINGVPLLYGTVASMICVPEDFYEGGDHIIIVGKVIQHTQRDAQVLLFSQGRYGVAQEHPSIDATRMNNLDMPILQLLRKAQNRVLKEFDNLREIEKLSVGEIVIMSYLNNNDNVFENNLDVRINFGVNETKDALADLIEKGYAEKLNDACILITESGKSRYEDLRNKIMVVENNFLNKFNNNEIEVSKRFLLNISKTI